MGGTRKKKKTHTLLKDGKNKSPNLSAVPHRAGHLVTNCSQLRIKSEAQAKQPWWILQYTAQQYCDNAFIIFFIVIHCVSPEIIPHIQVTEELTSSTAWNKPFTLTFTPTANLEGTSNLIFFFFGLWMETKKRKLSFYPKILISCCMIKALTTPPPCGLLSRLSSKMVKRLCKRSRNYRARQKTVLTAPSRRHNAPFVFLFNIKRETFKCEITVSDWKHTYWFSL